MPLKKEIPNPQPAYMSHNPGRMSPEKLDRMIHVEQQGLSFRRLFRIFREFYSGYKFIRQFKRSATFFGSARCGFDEHVYNEAEELAFNLAKEGFAIVTGGGPGIMEAANKGAVAAGGLSVGLNIELPEEQRVNPFVKLSHSFHYFFSRKVMLDAVSQIYIFFPGGYGTLDELFEMLTLVQTKRITSNIAILLVDKNYWQPMIDWLEKTVQKENYAISEQDLQLFHVVDSAGGALQVIHKMILENRFDRPRKRLPIFNNPAGIYMPGACPLPGTGGVSISPPRPKPNKKRWQKPKKKALA